MSTIRQPRWSWLHANAIAAQTRLEPGQFPMPEPPPAPTSLAVALRLDHAEVANGATVYYVKRGCDCLVKIGYTRQATEARVAQLSNVYPAPYLVATEPGGRYVEAFRHSQFAALRALPARGVDGGTEWFWPYSPLEDHMILLSPWEEAA